jgi:Fis family transcriptional regulator
VKEKLQSKAKQSKNTHPAIDSVNGTLIHRTLKESTETALQEYFQTLNGNTPNGLYKLVINEVELPLIEAVMAFTNKNQSQAAEILGINRSTLRKKLKLFELIK